MTNNTLLTDDQLAALTINGEASMLVIDPSRGDQYIMRYTANELAEVLTHEQRDALTRNQAVHVPSRIGAGTLWINMIGAARAAAEL